MKKAEAVRRNMYTYYFIRRDTKVFINFTSYSAFLRHSKKSLPRECYLNLHTLHTHSHNPLFNGLLFKKKILRLSVTKGRATFDDDKNKLEKTYNLSERKKAIILFF